jgi:hypothetical protein
MTPIVAPEHFGDHEVIVKALMRVCVGEWVHGRGFVA